MSAVHHVNGESMIFKTWKSITRKPTSIWKENRHEREH